MHKKNTTIKYPEKSRAEDTDYLKEWMKLNYYKIDHKFNYLFIRAYHGKNTWEKAHFKRRIRSTEIATLQYLWYKFIKRNIFDHPRFQLNKKARQTFEQYKTESKELNLF